MIYKFFLCIFILFLFSGCFVNLKTHPTIVNKNYSKYAIYKELLLVKKQWSKTPYVLGGCTKKGADCSGFTQSVLRNFGVKIPRTTKTQIKSGKKIPKAKLQSGDLVFFKTGRGPNGMHVGIYLQDKKFIHLSTKGGAKEASLDNSYWKERYIGARRYL